MSEHGHHRKQTIICIIDIASSEQKVFNTYIKFTRVPLSGEYTCNLALVHRIYILDESISGNSPENNIAALAQESHRNFLSPKILFFSLSKNNLHVHCIYC